MNLTREAGDSWFERTFAVEHDGETVAIFDEQPTLDDPREAKRQYDEPTEQLDPWQAGRLCTECNREINGRFAADIDGDLQCRDYAMEA